MTSVWPALWPPWKRTTTSARCDSQSTILPLPSSPHWAPITATLAISSILPSVPASVPAISLSHQRDPVVDPGMTAFEAARLGGDVAHRREAGDGRPAFRAERGRDGQSRPGGQVETTR